MPVILERMSPDIAETVQIVEVVKKKYGVARTLTFPTGRLVFYW